MEKVQINEETIFTLAGKERRYRLFIDGNECDYIRYPELIRLRYMINKCTSNEPRGVLCISSTRRSACVWLRRPGERRYWSNKQKEAERRILSELRARILRIAPDVTGGN